MSDPPSPRLRRGMHRRKTTVASKEIELLEEATWKAFSRKSNNGVEAAGLLGNHFR